MVDDVDAFRHGLTTLSTFFGGGATLGDTLEQVARLACDAIPRADLAGITLLVEGRPATAVFTDPELAEIDRAQYGTGIGPCVEAFRHGVVNRIDDTGTDTRWQAFSQAAAAHGVNSTISMPMVAATEPLGALNLYARDAAFTDDDEHTCAIFADHAAIVLANAQAYWNARQLSENLSEAMKSRAVIEQAKGVLMAAGVRSPDDAFEVMVRASQRENRKLRDIAQDIVHRTCRSASDLTDA